MDRFLQLHFLTAYPPSNVNRDDLGRPKSAMMGGVPRLRISSQSLKRAWRTSDVVQDAVRQAVGVRSRRAIQEYVFDSLIDAGISEEQAAQWCWPIAHIYGEPEAKKQTDAKKRADVRIKQLVHLSPAEVERLQALAKLLSSEQREPTDDELNGLIGGAESAVDIALFGRMLAAKPRFNVEASCQVAHAVSVEAHAGEDDYFSAVDDLNTREEDSGAGHINTQGFGATVYYLYVCLDRRQLLSNLGGDHKLAADAIAALISAAATVPPSGKQNSFASRPRANYGLAELGSMQPRTLAAAFFNPVKRGDVITAAVKALAATRANFNEVYGDAPSSTAEFDVATGSGKLSSLMELGSAGLADD